MVQLKYLKWQTLFITFFVKDWGEGTFKLVKGLIKGTYNSLTWPNLEMSLIVFRQIVTFSSIFDLNYYSHQTIVSGNF